MNDTSSKSAKNLLSKFIFDVKNGQIFFHFFHLIIVKLGDHVLVIHEWLRSAGQYRI